MVRVTARGPAPAAALALVLAACSFGTPKAGSGTQGTTTPPPTTTPVTIQSCGSTCADFPSAPVVAGGAGSNAAAMFAGNGSAPAPCITEPEDGTLFPNNWLRPRVKVSAPGATLLEIRFHTALESNDLVVYTAADNWALDNNTWANLAAHVVDHPITVTARTHGPSGLSAPSTATFTIAPVGASGQLVYWALRGFNANDPSNTQLYGFFVGDEGVVSVLTVPQIQETANGVQMGCIGCHTATPDGSYVGFTGNYPWPNALASVSPGSAEYYPAFSPDDALIAFNRLTQADASVTPTGQPYDGGMYFNPAAEVWVVPSAGGSAIRLAANDPPACTPAVRPNTRVYPNKAGWDNSWAKWSPDVGSANGNKYYWLIFSSYRYDVSPPRGQLYMTALVKPEAGPIATFPAVYVWNQDLTTSNHTPAWDVFHIAPVD